MEIYTKMITLEQRIKGMSMPQFIVAAYVVTGVMVTVGMAFKK